MPWRMAGHIIDWLGAYVDDTPTAQRFKKFFTAITRALPEVRSALMRRSPRGTRRARRRSGVKAITQVPIGQGCETALR